LSRRAATSASKRRKTVSCVRWCRITKTLKDNYELLWEMPNNDGYLQLVGIMQKFIDQSISANTNYDPTRFPSGKVPMQQLLKDLLTAYKFGVKTLYYHNTRDGAEDAQDDLAPSIQDDGCESGACKIYVNAGWRYAYPAYDFVAR
jgi:ribonucleotide reductase alpha subunit